MVYKIVAPCAETSYFLIDRFIVFRRRQMGGQVVNVSQDVNCALLYLKISILIVKKLQDKSHILPLDIFRSLAMKLRNLQSSHLSTTCKR